MAAGSLKNRRKLECSACDGNNLVQVLDMPCFPITGIFLRQMGDGGFPGIDQGLMCCRDCGHGQLLNSVDPHYLYGPAYWHRSSASPIATTGNAFFAQFVDHVVGDQEFQMIVEVGCNDLYLLQKMERRGRRLFGIDPIWRGQEPEGSGNIQVIGKFVEEVDFVDDLGGRPDLIISAHTFEHIDDPKSQLQRLIQAAEPGALFVVEVPGFDSLLNSCRFDQVFHQHIQYFSLASFRRMIADIGGEYLTHTFNYSYWGGTMLVAFKKSASANGGSCCVGITGPTPELVHQQYRAFKDQLDRLGQTIDNLKQIPIYGFGAAQMVPTIAYHLDSDLSFLTCVLDDDPDRAGYTYPSLQVWTRQPDPDLDLSGTAVLVTALDSLRPILPRLISLQPRHILVPLNML